eukprot:CAMPEP_0115746156 /NCGR_PEP_ID=MMETSP0272-20121206/92489_1 /TAXON_ID=71861 /ORGANISM="Scrippsiella trochoidea, Strain CCMP3099" /LENGTH=91 /DNA_ID=CAMNT_0003191083 /DNA_START=1617 /DNA_END=1889 /DNA_ORIENTATION=-
MLLRHRFAGNSISTPTAGTCKSRGVAAAAAALTIPSAATAKAAVLQEEMLTLPFLQGIESYVGSSNGAAGVTHSLPSQAASGSPLCAPVAS